MSSEHSSIFTFWKRKPHIIHFTRDKGLNIPECDGDHFYYMTSPYNLFFAYTVKIYIYFTQKTCILEPYARY